MTDLVNKTEVIVVGGGPAGISCAITLARAGREVVLIERGSFCGSKNMFGGAIYADATREVFPNFEQSAPLERRNVIHKYILLGEEDSTSVSYRNKSSEIVSYSVIRSKFDNWMAQEAKNAGVILVEETVVKELIVENGFVVGVKTELEEYRSDIVVLADGVNSLLAKQIGLREELSAHDVALSVKEVYKLDKNKINERFHITDEEGCIYELFGGSMLGMLGLGFVYTYKDSISIGLGVTLSELTKRGLRPYEMLDEIKTHPSIAPLLKDGTLLEYSAHLIPEGGYKKIPKIFDNGLLVCGDAASFVNNLHWEGSNLAMLSGKIAGEVATVALCKRDVSAKELSNYQTKLQNSFIMKDLYTYRNLMSEMDKRAESLLGYYPRKINAFFNMFTSVNGVPKRKLYRQFIKDFVFGRPIGELFKDMWTLTKLLWSVLIK